MAAVRFSAAGEVLYAYLSGEVDHDAAQSLRIQLDDALVSRTPQTLVLDFGGQYNQLIARRVREHNIYCEVISYKTPIEQIKAKNPKGIIFTGGPRSVYLDDSPRMTKEIFELGVPIFGICYGAQFISYSNGGRVEPAGTREYGRAHLGSFDSENVLFKGVRKNTQVWMSHGDTITAIPDNFKIIASTDKVAIAA